MDNPPASSIRRASEADPIKIAEKTGERRKKTDSPSYKEQNPTKTKEVNIMMGFILVIMCVIGAYADLMED